MASPAPEPSTGGELSGKRALVTGGTRGIGRAAVQALTHAGAQVAYTARAPSTDAPGVPALFIQADVGTKNGVATISHRVHERLGGADILVHNVGGDGDRHVPLLEQTDDVWQLVLDLNLMGSVRLDRALVPGMIARRSGAVVHISSLSRSIPSTNRVPYGAAKAALTL
jgi:NAD(P)-dependent dehydrogenase (short-subunit alcohol dehydrogenase family)